MKKSQLRQIIKECIQEVLEGEKFSLYEIPFVSGMSVEGVTPGEASIITTPEDLKYHQEKIEKAFGVDVVFKEQVTLIEEEITKTTAAAKGRCRSAANKIKNLSAEFKKSHK